MIDGLNDVLTSPSLVAGRQPVAIGCLTGFCSVNWIPGNDILFHLFFQPHRRRFHYLLIHFAIFGMGTRQVANAH